MPISVFVSVGKTSSREQELFVSGIETNLEKNGLRPRTVGRSESSSRQPLRAIHRLMDRCAGALVVALPRVMIEKAIERRGEETTMLSGTALATPWNQIEAAIAYSKGIPLLVIKEGRVREEGLLERCHDWAVLTAPVDPMFLDSAEFAGPFERWRRDVVRRAGWFRYRG